MFFASEPETGIKIVLVFFCAAFTAASAVSIPTTLQGGGSHRNLMLRTRRTERGRNSHTSKQSWDCLGHDMTDLLREVLVR